MKVIYILLLSGILVACQSVQKTENKPSDIPDWQSLYSQTNKYYNMTDTIVNLRSGPGVNYVRIGVLQPNEGGLIMSCGKETVEWCAIRGTNLDKTGWVKMEFMSMRED